jgi:hypothetical protein
MPKPPPVDEYLAALDEDGLLEGNDPDRRTVYFESLEDVVAKRPRLEAAIREWIAIKDRANA